MTLPALANLDDFSVRLGNELSESDEARAQAALEDSSALIRAEAGVTWVTDDDLDDVPDIIVTLCLKVARRAFVNPDEISQEGSGSYSVSYREVYLTTSEKRLIRQAAGVASAGIGVLSTTRGPIETAALVCGAGADAPVEETDPYSLWT